MKAMLIKTTTACLLTISVTYANAETLADYFTEWESLCSEEIEGSVILPTPDNRYMRNVSLTNVLHSLSTNNYNLVEYRNHGEYHIPFLQLQSADYAIGGNSNVIFAIEYVTSSDKNIGGLVSLGYLTRLYSTRAGKLFRQYSEGVGDVCLLDTSANVTSPTTIRNAFFCRDNVAVRVRNLHGGDILAFIKLLDACILASSAE